MRAKSRRTARRCRCLSSNTNLKRFCERASGAAGGLAHGAGRSAPVRFRIRGWDGGSGQPVRIRDAAGLPFVLPRRPRRGLRQALLEEHSDSDVRVYVVWFNMLSGDSRSGWDECVMSDPRANHLWDEKRLASRAFAGEVEGAPAPVWDAYLLYDPGATWDDAPTTPISSGYTVYGAREELEKNVVP